MHKKYSSGEWIWRILISFQKKKTRRVQFILNCISKSVNISCGPFIEQPRCLLYIFDQLSFQSHSKVKQPVSERESTWDTGLNLQVCEPAVIAPQHGAVVAVCICNQVPLPRDWGNWNFTQQGQHRDFPFQHHQR